MKKIASLLVIVLCLTSCSVAPKSTQQNKITKAEATQDEDEWEVLVFDAEFETFLISRANPRSMFTEEILHTRNQTLVNEWNSRFYSGTANRDIYEVSIDYNANTIYGFEFEYRLYQFFAFVNWKFGEQFFGLSKTDTF